MSVTKDLSGQLNDSLLKPNDLFASPMDFYDPARNTHVDNSISGIKRDCEFILQPLRTKTIYLLKRILSDSPSEKPIDCTSDDPLQGPIILESSELVRAARCYHIEKLSTLNNLGDFRDYLLLLLPELNESCVLTQDTCKTLRRQLVTLMILSRGDVAMYMASKHLASSTATSGMAQYNRSDKRRNSSIVKDGIKQRKIRQEIPQDFRGESNYNLKSSSSQSENSDRDNVIQQIEEFQPSEFKLFQHVGGILLIGHDHDTLGCENAHEDMCTMVQSNEYGLKAIINEKYTLVIGNNHMNIVEKRNTKTMIISGFLSTCYFRGYTVKFFPCYRYGHGRSRNMAIKFCRLRRPRGRPVTRIPRGDLLHPDGLPNESKIESISRNSIKNRLENNSTKLAKLQARADEFPHVEGISFDADSFSWIAQYNGEFRRFLVKKYGWEKSRYCAIRKLEEWRQLEKQDNSGRSGSEKAPLTANEKSNQDDNGNDKEIDS